MNPYKGRPDYTFWKTGVAGPAAAGVDPVVAAPFAISASDHIATAGSCFAQHISRMLARRGLRYLVTETFRPGTGAVDEGYAVFPARFGNVYTSRQLLQLFDRAYGLRHPESAGWRGKAGGILDPFRPRIQAGGFASLEAMLNDRERHLACVRRMFETCQIFVFTLGLTESWISTRDGSAFPLAPGVVAADEDDFADVAFHNLSVGEVVADLDRFLRKLRDVNPTVKLILTVSPVPLVATFEDRHVLVSTIASKSILRAAADEICRAHDGVAYFPSYEIVTGPQTGAAFYAPDLREVTEAGVDFVMSVFARHYLPADAPPAAAPATPLPAPDAASAKLSAEDRKRFAAVAAVICDEEAIVS